MQRKSLLAAWFLNIIPGCGLIYAGQKVLGIIFAVIGFIALILCFTGIGGIIGIPVIIILQIIVLPSSLIVANNYNKSLLLNEARKADESNRKEQNLEKSEPAKVYQITFDSNDCVNCPVCNAKFKLDAKELQTKQFECTDCKSQIKFERA